MNFLIHIFLKIFVNIIVYKRKILYFKLIHIFSYNDYIYSYDGLKIYKPKIRNDITYRYTVAGIYMGEFQKKLLRIKDEFYFLDIGSNIGYFSLVAGSNKKLRKIFSIEANPVIKKHLDKNLNLNFSKKKYETYNLAISNKIGKLNFYINKKDSGSSSLIKKNKFSKLIRVKSKNFKLFNEIGNKIKKKKVVVKIDVEGKDLEVLKELKKSNIFKNIFYLYIESKNENKKINDIKKNLVNFSLKKKHSIIENLKNKKQVDLEFIKK
tara:strand:- start:16 stop:813 length:798 start_codon:yes stop_codon:yes gene_type:complete